MDAQRGVLVDCSTLGPFNVLLDYCNEPTAACDFAILAGWEEIRSQGIFRVYDVGAFYIDFFGILRLQKDIWSHRRGDTPN